MSTPPITFPDASVEGIPLEEPRPPAHDPDNPPWGLPGALGVLILSFVLMVVTQVFFLIPYTLWRGVRLGALAEFALNDAGAIFMQIVSIVPAHLLTLGLAWLLVTRVGRHPFLKTLGWEWGKGFTFWRCVWLAVLLYLTGVSILKLAGPTDNALERLIQSSRAAALATAFAATFTAPLVEELIFRGLLYSSLRRLVGTVWAVAVVFLLFALIHVPQYWPSYGVIATILLLSFVLTMIRARTGRLLPCFVVHLIFNGIQSVLIVLEPYLKSYVETNPTPAPGLLVELLLGAFGAAF
ncbi:MAG TPA: type II CAAX endopeptidase family protein [Pyrinomonadaceae bacterium]